MRTFEIKIQCVCYSNEANAFRIHATFDCRLMPFASRESPQCLRTRGLFLRCSITSLHCAVARRLDCDGVSHLFDQARIFIFKKKRFKDIPFIISIFFISPGRHNVKTNTHTHICTVSAAAHLLHMCVCVCLYENGTVARVPLITCMIASHVGPQIIAFIN